MVSQGRRYISTTHLEAPIPHCPPGPHFRGGGSPLEEDTVIGLAERYAAFVESNEAMFTILGMRPRRTGRALRRLVRDYRRAEARGAFDLMDACEQAAGRFVREHLQSTVGSLASLTGT